MLAPKAAEGLQILDLHPEHGEIRSTLSTRLQLCQLLWFALHAFTHAETIRTVRRCHLVARK